MTLGSSLVPVTILFTWLIHLIVAFNLKSRHEKINTYYQGLWKILAYIGVVLVMLEVFHIATSITLGFIYEEFAFKSRFYGAWFGWMLNLDLFAPPLFCLNFWPRLRNSLVFRNFQLLVILTILLIRMALIYNLGISFVPGWHTTIDLFSCPLTLLIAGMAIFGLNRSRTKTEKN